jgi:hypothetical protein
MAQRLEGGNKHNVRAGLHVSTVHVIALLHLFTLGTVLEQSGVKRVRNCQYETCHRA